MLGVETEVLLPLLEMGLVESSQAGGSALSEPLLVVLEAAIEVLVPEGPRELVVTEVEPAVSPEIREEGLEGFPVLVPLREGELRAQVLVPPEETEQVSEKVELLIVEVQVNTFQKNFCEFFELLGGGEKKIYY